MTTNGEWLFSKPFDEQVAWMNAEHKYGTLDGIAAALEAEYGKGGMVGGSFCDTPEQGEVVMPLESWREHLDTEKQNGDSRYKLEADAHEIADDYNMDTQRHGTERFAHELYYSIIHLLDRQAAITEEQTRCKWVTASADEIAAWRSKAEKLQAKVTELTAERNELKESSEYYKLQYELASEDADRLTAERDELKGQVFTLKCECDDLENERDKLQEQLRIGWECECRLQAEREDYRKKFGKCIDYADAIHALMDDEGMA